MRIIKITEQFRRDFMATFKCEHCGNEETRRGYDDSYFHRCVIPQMKCGACGKAADKNYRPLATKYPDSMTI